MATYIAFLRGINVGGNNLINMAELRAALSEDFEDVRTYIQSGNVLFDSPHREDLELARQVESVIEKRFSLPVRVAVFEKPEWKSIIDSAPKWWGRNEDWKHNILIMLEPVDMTGLVNDYGTLKPDIEKLETGKRVLYQSLSFKDFSRTAGGKLAGKPIYQQMTIRNYNTATRLADFRAS